MKKKIAFIIPYFGKFNNYFQVWLHTCRHNPDIDWLIFTDDHWAYNYPENVKVFYTTFSETVKKIQAQFDFKIELSKPYILCEFKVAFGEVYADYIQNYDFWGYCDTDILWGNLKSYITDEILNKYNKISWRGHLTLYKNDKHINSLYRTPIEGNHFYKSALSNTTGFPLAMDEREINYIFKNAGEKIYDKLIFADLKIRSYTFSLLHFPVSENYKNKNQIFLWDKGELFRMYCYNNKLYKENFAYIHFLKRDMQVDKNFNFNNKFLIVPNKLINYTGDIDCKVIIHFSEKRIYWNYVFSRLSLKYLKSKVLYYYSKHLFKKKYPALPLKTLDFKLPKL